MSLEIVHQCETCKHWWNYDTENGVCGLLISQAAENSDDSDQKKAADSCEKWEAKESQEGQHA